MGCRAGTGLLSMMAARAMAKFDSQKEGKVTACESYLPMWKLMQRVLRANGMETMVKVFYKCSDELQVGVELESPADLLVGSPCFCENLVLALFRGQKCRDSELVPEFFPCS